MAARKVRQELNDRWRERIQTSMLINRLQDQALGKLDMSQTQIKAAEILLARVAPTLTATELTTVDESATLTEADLLLQLQALIEQHPDLVQQALAAKARKDSDMGASLGATDTKAA